MTEAVTNDTLEQSAINKKTQRSSDAKTSDVVVAAERRSTRTRAPPKDPYVDGLVAEMDAKKSIPKKEPVPKRSGGRKKKLSAAQLWSPQNVVTEDSPLVKADLKASPFILEFDQSFAN
jgi:hypothetical protein